MGVGEWSRRRRFSRLRRRPERPSFLVIVLPVAEAVVVVAVSAAGNFPSAGRHQRKTFASSVCKSTATGTDNGRKAEDEVY